MPTAENGVPIRQNIVSGEVKREPDPGAIRGLIVPMFTPVLRDGNGYVIDEQATVNLTDRLITGGADALFILGKAGMFQKLTVDQKITFIDTVIDAVAVNDRTIPVVVGITSEDQNETIVLAQYCEHKKADALVYIPSYGDGNPDSKILTILLKTESVPLIFYNNPGIQPENKSLDFGVIRKFVAYPRIIGIKNSSPDLATYTRLVQELQSPHFRVFVGHSENILPAMRLRRSGEIPEFAGCVPVQANLDPERFARLVRDDGSISDKEAQAYIHAYRRTVDILSRMVSDGRLDQATYDLYVRSTS